MNPHIIQGGAFNWIVAAIQNQQNQLSLYFAQTYGDYIILFGQYEGKEALIKIYDLLSENEEFSITPSKLARWRRQTYVLPLINHPNVVKMLEYTAEKYRITFEKLSGYTLYDHLKTPNTNPLIGNFSVSKTVPEFFARFLLRELIHAVKAVHKKGYAHLNINLANVMITYVPPDNHLSVKLIDFGYSSPLHANEMAWRILQEQPFGNRTLFLPPDFHNTTLSSFDSYDIYLMGIVLFSLVMGFPPYFAAVPQKRLLYDMLCKEDFEGFWAKIKNIYKQIYQTELNLTPSFIKCITFMLAPNSITRYSLP
jgi:serine/threonine protein kinase